MRVGVLTTDGGPHPADKWASETAAEILTLVKVDDTSTSEEATAARKAKPRLEIDIAEAVEAHHEDNIARERKKLATYEDRLNYHYDLSEAGVSATVDSIVAVAEKYGEPFASAFASVNGRALIENTVRVHFASAAHVERSWHSDSKLQPGVAAPAEVWAFHKRVHG